ncbi:hypothetical protein DOQ65_13015 [Salmonella enterica subsp. enterica serovar Richmond]|nr:hypothetical protein [Salmonella enterica subsp. enterica serovar Richmond]EDR2497328.1 hypothetical protein [Salmonella enterica subsp. enterica serovar Richmond]EDS5284980.1 hypothetical protein [Salmonella enterica subsp. enterica serovar Richmond]EDV0607458.1 hypothetical protein [Salmonella enterica subsp. enterica serovar Richmond]EDW2372559.1 hypothetical protein [Salmonella enterica subsp. enterica serovar Richmond]
MANSAQKPVVYLPYVCAVDPDDHQPGRWIRETENQLLDRVKAALDEAGVAWIDPRTKERSKPDDTDSEEEPEDIRYAIRQHLYYGDTLTRTMYISHVFICKNAAQENAEKFTEESKVGMFTTQCEVVELTPQIVNEIRNEHGWNNPITVYRALPDNWKEGKDNAQ